MYSVRDLDLFIDFLTQGDAPKATTPKQVPAPAEPPVFAPAVCWRPARVAVDISLAERLIRKCVECPGFCPRATSLIPYGSSGLCSEI